MRPNEEQNFCRVFELPAAFPGRFCFGGGIPVVFHMVDWFRPWPDDPAYTEWEQVELLLRGFLRQKIYVKPGRSYVVITDFGKSLVFTGEAK